LAYHFGPRKDVAFKALKEKLRQFDIDFYYTDDQGAYERHLPISKHFISKRNTQAIERKHLTFRIRIKRLARKTICFSRLELIHDAVIGLFINLFEFGRLI
jgi:insertion element IS1 protein InsB